MSGVLMRIGVLVMGVLAVVGLSGESLLAQGQSKTANLKVSATVVANCLVTVADVAFGNYDPVGANATTPLDAEGSVTLSCTQGAHARVKLGFGQHAVGNQRSMASTAGNARLLYELYLNPTRTQPWNSPYGFFPGTGASTSPAPVTNQVYGRVAAGQNVPVGAFADEVLVIVSF